MPSRLELVFILAALISLNALAIDIMLPALGLISDDYGLVDPNLRQMVVILYIAGTSFGSIFYGSLADRFGRRAIFLICLAFYALFAAICAVTDSFELLVAARFMQGLAAAGPMVLVQSVVRDLYEGDEMASLMSTVMMVFLIVPVVAPIIGAGLLEVTVWHGIFWFLAAAGVVIMLWTAFRLPETLSAERIRPLHLKTILGVGHAIVKHRNSVGHTVASGLTIGALFAFVASAQQLFSIAFGVPELFVYLFGINAGLMSVASFTNSRIVKRFGARRVSQSAIITSILLASTIIILAETGLLHLWLFVVLFGLCAAMLGFTGANLQSIAMSPFAVNAGAASSFQTFVRLCLATACGAMIGMSFDGTVVPLSLGLLLCNLGALLLVGWAEKWQFFRRPRDVKMVEISLR